jgi:hypothetical protein
MPWRYASHDLQKTMIARFVGTPGTPRSSLRGIYHRHS